MSQFAKHRRIYLNSLALQHLAQALEQYVCALDEGWAFRREMNLLFDIEFHYGDEQSARPLCRDDVPPQTQALFARAMAKTRDKQGREVHQTEAVLFALALNYAELTPALIRVAKAMVRFARCRNNSGDMFLDDERVFGLEGLYMLACQDPELAYLLAQFLVPYWDSELDVGADTLFASLIEQHGWCDGLLRAYVHCDNSYFRRSFQSEALNLAGLLTEDDALYARFCTLLQQRLTHTEVLVYHGAEGIPDTPAVNGFFCDLNPEWWLDEDEEYADEAEILEQSFRQQTVAAAIADFMSQQNENEHLGYKLAPAHTAQYTPPVYWQEQGAVAPIPEAQIDANTPLDENIDAKEEWEQVISRFSCGAYVPQKFHFEQLDMLIEAQGFYQPDEWSQTAGMACMAAYCLLHAKTPDVSPVTDWLEGFCFDVLYKGLARYGLARRADSLASIESYLTQLHTEFNAHQVLEAVKEVAVQDGGTRGSHISFAQPAYAVFFFNGGFQTQCLTLFLLRQYALTGRASEKLNLLSQRWWDLLLALAPFKVLSQCLMVDSSYPQNVGIEDTHLEQRRHQALLDIGVPDAVLQVFSLFQHQALGAYQPALPRFWQSYVTRLDAYVSKARGAEPLFDELLTRVSPARQMQFWGHISARYPEVDIGEKVPLRQVLNDFIAMNLRNEKLEASQLVELTLDYLQGKAEREAVVAAYQKGFRGRLELEGDRGQIALSRYLWLLPQAQRDALVVLLIHYSPRGWKLFEANDQVAEGWVREQMLNQTLTLESRWTHPVFGYAAIGDSDVGEQRDQELDTWLLSYLSGLPLDLAQLVCFALSYKRPAHLEYLKTLSREGELVDVLPKLDPVQRREIADITKEKTSRGIGGFFKRLI